MSGGERFMVMTKRSATLFNTSLIALTWETRAIISLCLLFYRHGHGRYDLAYYSF